MPDTIRTDGGARTRPRGSGSRAMLPFACGLVGLGCAGAADAAAGTPAFDSAIESAFNRLPNTIVALALCAAFAAIAATLLSRARRRLAEARAKAADDLVAAKAKADRLNMLLRAERRILVVWEPAADEPDIIGDPALITRRETANDLLDFGNWLDPANARNLDSGVEGLRSYGQRFASALKTRYGRLVEAEGTIVGGRAVLRLNDVTGVERDLADLSLRLQKQTEDAEALRTLVEALPTPIWARGESGKVAFANAAYAGAVEARDGAEAVRRGIELFDRAAREELLHAHQEARPFHGRLPAIVAGTRRTFNVISYPARHGSAGIAIDATEVDALRAEVSRMT